jgi:hypothetical protein
MGIEGIDALKEGDDSVPEIQTQFHEEAYDEELDSPPEDHHHQSDDPADLDPEED